MGCLKLTYERDFCFSLAQDQEKPLARTKKRLSTYKYKYNGKELQEELGFNVTDMDYRQYDMAIGRFNTIDALSEASRDITPYRFAYNNPIYFSDPSGLLEEGLNGSNALTGWVNKGGKTFWDPNVNNAGDVKKLYGDTAKYVADDTVTPNGDGTSTKYNADGTKSTILKEVAISTPKPSKIEKPKEDIGKELLAAALITSQLDSSAPGPADLVALAMVTWYVLNYKAINNAMTTTIGHYDSMSQKGKNNGKLQQDELESILAKAAAGIATSAELQKLKKHQKNSGERNSRQSKDKK